MKTKEGNHAASNVKISPGGRQGKHYSATGTSPSAARVDMHLKRIYAGAAPWPKQSTAFHDSMTGFLCWEPRHDSNLSPFKPAPKKKNERITF